jgi:hypothetical protein
MSLFINLTLLILFFRNKTTTNKSLNTDQPPSDQIYRFILPRTPLQQLYINHTSIINKK